MTSTNPAIESLFESHRPMLWQLGYRLTGSAADADDIAQETFVRALRRRTPAPHVPWRPWLIRVATNLAIDELRRRRRRGYSGDWLPSPVDTPPIEETLVDSAPDPARQYEQSQEASYALLVALEALSPRQRAVLVLREVADYSVSEVGRALGMSDGNVRITHHRTRRILRNLDSESARPVSEMGDTTRGALQELVRCLRDQDVVGLEALLSASVYAVTDGAGEFNALRRPMIGRKAVMRLLLSVSRRRGPGAHIDVRSLNGQPALRVVYKTSRGRQAPRAVLISSVDAFGRIQRIYVVLSSRKLTGVRFEV